MNLLRLAFCAGWFAVAAAAQDSKPAYASPAKEKIELRVLYAGAPDHPRTADFAAFLGATFSKVGTIDLVKLDAPSAKDFDVVIIDSPSPYADGGKFKMPKGPALKDWNRPTILMGAAGGQVVTTQKIKLDWL